MGLVQKDIAAVLLMILLGQSIHCAMAQLACGGVGQPSFAWLRLFMYTVPTSDQDR